MMYEAKGTKEFFYQLGREYENRTEGGMRWRKTSKGSAEGLSEPGEEALEA